MKSKRFVLPWWSGFTLALVLPLTFFGFLLSGPHTAWVACAFTLPVWGLIALEAFAGDETRSIPSSAPDWVFDGLLCLLAVIQVVNVLTMGFMVESIHWGGWSENGLGFLNLVVLRVLGGTTFCCSVIAPAHELIHRRAKWQRSLGRWMLMLTFYDHFAIAHRHGHHARLGTQGDPSTAEKEESYEAFFWRSLNRQWRIALGTQPRQVWLGVLVEGMLVVVYGLTFGGLALFAWLYISGVAIRLLESVNYFQHYGLTVGSLYSSSTAWSADSKISYFLFLGLTRHADHHRRPSVPFQRLQSTPHALHLPHGYLWTALWVKNRNESFRRWMESEMSARSRAGQGRDRPLAVSSVRSKDDRSSLRGRRR